MAGEEHFEDLILVTEKMQGEGPASKERLEASLAECLNALGGDRFVAILQKLSRMRLYQEFAKVICSS